MAHGSAQEVAAKWRERASGSTQAYADGVRRVRESPGASAARNVAGYVAGVQQSSAKWQRNVAAMPLGEWQNRAAELGAQRIPGGVAAAEGRMAQAMTRILPMVDSAAAAARAMPGQTTEQRIQRAVRFMTQMHQSARG